MVNSDLLVYFLLKKMIRDIYTKGRAQHLTDLLVYFWSNKKIKNMTKNSDISPRKFKNIESPKMVSKQLKGHYLRSYEQFEKKSDFKCFFCFFVRFFFHVISYLAHFGAQRLSLYCSEHDKLVIVKYY